MLKLNLFKSKNNKELNKSLQLEGTNTPHKAFKKDCKEKIWVQLAQWAKYETGYDFSIKDRKVLKGQEAELKEELKGISKGIINHFFESEEARKKPFKTRCGNIQEFLNSHENISGVIRALDKIKKEEENKKLENLLKDIGVITLVDVDHSGEDSASE